jgi:hypothetical protein
MSVRAVGALLVLALAGVGAGYGVSSLDTSVPLTISVAAPVPGESPSYPVNEYDVQPDPDDPALRPGVALRDIRLRQGADKLDISVPRGWFQGGKTGAWVYSVPANGHNAYYLRVNLFPDQQSVGVKKIARIGALDEAEANDAMQNVIIESETDDGFVATYLQGGYRRVSMERFLTVGRTTAYVTVAVIGREVDREGMADLLERVSASLRIPG